jgi:ectoine hydroxylase-related dioxygenase (phytanoyl-CoA dioxygenase family)
MPKGSVVFWMGGTLHGLGVNRSDEPRTGIVCTLVVDWLTPEENTYFAVPPEIARSLPERAQQLLGYRSSISLGCVAGRASENWLAEESEIGS